MVDIPKMTTFFAYEIFDHFWFRESIKKTDSRCRENFENHITHQSTVVMVERGKCVLRLGFYLFSHRTMGDIFLI